MIDNWNSVVGKGDKVYHLGDFCFKNGRSFEDYISCLHGQIYLIWGNHDQAAKKYYKDNFPDSYLNKIKFLGDYKRISVNGQDIILSHYSFRVWDKCHHGSWNLFGHSHGTLPDDPHRLGIDVGVDAQNYFPIEFKQVQEIMNKKLWQPIDYHGERQEGGGLGLSREDYAKAERYRLYQQFVKEFGK